jgi:hypothetical protein
VLATSGGSTTAARIRRLLAEPQPASRKTTAAGFAGVAALVLLPVLLLAGPATAVMPQNACEFPTDCTNLHLSCPLVTPGRHNCLTG